MPLSGPTPGANIAPVTADDRSRCAHRLSEDERLFRDSVLRVRRPRNPAARARDGRARDDPAAAHRQAVRRSASWASRFPEQLRRRRRHASFTAVLAVEALSRVDPSVGVLVDVQNTLVDQRAPALGQRRAQAALSAASSPPSTVGAYALSEAGSGSDAFALATRAVGARRRLGAHRAEAVDHQRATRPTSSSCSPTSNPDAGYRGITAFLVERGFAGLHGRQEGRQARHPREQHVRAAASTTAACRAPTCSARSARATRWPSRR